MRTGTPACQRATILLAIDVSCMNQKAMSMPTFSLSIKLHSGTRQSWYAVSHRVSCARVWVERRLKRMIANATWIVLARIKREQLSQILLRPKNVSTGDDLGVDRNQIHG